MNNKQSYVIEPAEPVALPVQGETARFPVNNIYCVGRNYADHVVEMGGDPNREPPFFFMKPGYALLQDGGTMEYPSHSDNVHHEVELVAALAAGGRDVSVAEAMNLVYGYAVGIDMTRRDLQGKAKNKGQPWEEGKSFRHAAPCSAIQPKEKAGDMTQGEITLSVNGKSRQAGNVNQMIWKLPEVISKLSSLFVLSPGDLIFTGTPAGVGPIARGDQLSAAIAGVGDLHIAVAG